MKKASYLSVSEVLEQLAAHLKAAGRTPKSNGKHLPTFDELADRLGVQLGAEPLPELVEWFVWSERNHGQFHPHYWSLTLSETLRRLEWYRSDATWTDSDKLIEHATTDDEHFLHLSHVDIMPFAGSQGAYIALNPATTQSDTGPGRVVFEHLGTIYHHTLPESTPDRLDTEPPAINLRRQLPTLEEWLQSILRQHRAGQIVSIADPSIEAVTTETPALRYRSCDLPRLPQPRGYRDLAHPEATETSLPKVSSCESTTRRRTVDGGLSTVVEQEGPNFQ